MTTTLKPFQTTAPENLPAHGGYGSGDVSPVKLADDLFKAEIPGPWLCCYMLRRFGWPNEGSDDHKNLMSWNLTTPIKGLWLCVTPYLGSDGDGYDPNAKFSCANMHFAVRFTESVGQKLAADIGRDAYFRRHNREIMGWWRRKGIKLYAWGVGKKEGDEDELVHKWSDHAKDDKLVFGLWRRTARVKGVRDLPKQLVMAEWWLAQLIKKHHPEVKLSKMTAKDRRQIGNPFRRKAEIALKRTMLDLLRPTNVRDINFNCFGRTEGPKSVPAKLVLDPHAEPWPGAGNTPAYWYSAEGLKERKKLKAASLSSR